MIIQHDMINIQHSMMNIQHDMMNIQHHTINIQHSMMNIQHDMINIQHQMTHIQHSTVTNLLYDREMRNECDPSSGFTRHISHHSSIQSRIRFANSLTGTEDRFTSITIISSHVWNQFFSSHPTQRRLKFSKLTRHFNSQIDLRSTADRDFHGRESQNRPRCLRRRAIKTNE